MKKIIPVYFLLLFCISANTLSAQKNVQGRIDSLETVLKTASDTSKIKALLELCSVHQQTNPNNVPKPLEEATQMAKELNSTKWIAECLYTQGLFEYGKGNFSLAKKNYQEALALFEQEKNLLRMASMIYSIGVLEVYTGNYAAANEHFFRALKINETLNKRNLMSNCYSSIGNVYGRLGNSKKEEEFHLKGLEIRLELKDSYGISASYINLGNVYGRRKIYDTALSYYFKGLKIAEENKNQKWILNALGNIGSVYAEQKKYDDALKYLSKGLELVENIGDKKALTTYLNTIGQCYMSLEKLSIAKSYFERALAVSKATGNKEEMKGSYLNLAEHAEKNGDFKQAYEYHISYSAMKDSLFNEENSSQMNEMQAKYDSEKQEQQIVLLNKDKEIQTANFKQQQIISWAIGAGLFIVVILAFFIFRQFKEKQKANIALQSAYIEIEVKNKDITDSINYAKRIQAAILPAVEDLQKQLSNSFIIYQPKDIVSGDFYWFAEKGNQLIVAIADCTGHGVPGAFMSMVGNDILTQIVIEKGITRPNLILTNLHEGVKKSLKQDSNASNTKDGMDIAIVSFDKTNYSNVEYAGALRPLWLIKNNTKEIVEYKADKHSIGGAYTSDARGFTNHELKLSKGDSFYLSTDGYADQFGGELGKKMMTKNMKELLISIQSKTMAEQKVVLENNFQSWKASREQVDDVLVFGVRIA